MRNYACLCYNIVCYDIVLDPRFIKGRGCQTQELDENVGLLGDMNDIF